MKKKKDKISEKLTDAFDFSIANIILTKVYPNTNIPEKRADEILVNSLIFNY